MLGVVFLICLYMAMRQAAGDVQAAWGKSRTSGGKHVSSGQVARTLNRVLSMAPVARHGFATGWHQESQRQHAARAARAKARADHLETRAKLAPEIAEHNRRAAAAKEQIRAARRGSGTVTENVDEAGDAGPGDTTVIEDDWDAPLPGEEDGPQDRVTYSYGRAGQRAAWPTDDPEEAKRRAAAMSGGGDTWDVHRYVNGGPGEKIASYRNGKEQPTTTQEPSTEGSGDMAAGTAGDVNYTEHLGAYTKVSELAEEYAGDKRLTEMQGILSQVDGTGLDKDSLSDAADVDDALRTVQEAVQRLSDVASSAQQGLQQRHGEINEAVQNSSVDKPAEPEYYAA